MLGDILVLGKDWFQDLMGFFEFSLLNPSKASMNSKETN